MIIVLIHWKIRRNAEARSAFLKHWHETLEIADRSKLAGEFLSEPFTAERGAQAGIPCGLFNAPPSAPYDSFFNVGIWEDENAFYSEIIRPFVGREPKPLPFEFEFRERMVLSPVSSRAGKFGLPTTDHFADAA